MDTIKIEIQRDNAMTLLEILDRRLEVIQGVEKLGGRIVALEIAKEKEAIVPVIMALEAALKAPRRQ